MTVHLTAGALAATVDAYTVAVTRVGIGVSDLRIEGLTPDLSFTRPTLENAVTVPCGRVPALRIDGASFPTRVDTTVGAALAGPVDVTVCRTSAPGFAALSATTLTAGQVRVQAGTPGSWDVASVVLQRADGPAADAATLAQPVVRQWEVTERRLDLGARSTDSVLAMTENANSGWTARLGGTALRAVTVNGWQQGFVVPVERQGPSGCPSARTGPCGSAWPSVEPWPWPSPSERPCRGAVGHGSSSLPARGPGWWRWPSPLSASP